MFSIQLVIIIYTGILYKYVCHNQARRSGEHWFDDLPHTAFLIFKGKFSIFRFFFPLISFLLFVFPLQQGSTCL